MESKVIEDVVVLCATIVLNAIALRKITKTTPSCRVNPYLKERQNKGRFAKDFQDMLNNVPVFKENFHMSPESFAEIFQIVEPFLREKKNTRPSDKISALEKFAVVMEYLASGTIQRHVAAVYRISKQHFGTILDEVCCAISKGLESEIPVLDEPKFITIANEFNAFWNLPNCVRAIDGKHIGIKCPSNAGSMFYNYKLQTKNGEAEVVF
ncbi:uncharacterized protein LOC129918442 [Episyrphus balteatus]|uniref:uncharacterized protein LOC129918442 n=1 Tax=Episyrphus balteatus TaxID=286459 RepID=UPI002486B456|nr:uncharacterized protein LOC129918442 [Episyrphus balteatus]